MILSNWIPALTTTSLLAFVMWLLRSLISTRLTKSVENEFNTKLANLKSELKTKETQIDALRTGAMSGLISRQSKLFERQLESIEQIWEAMTELKKATYISKTMAILKFEECAKEAPTSPKLRSFFEQIGGDFDIKNINITTAYKARPFLPELAWAYYNAYQAIIFHDVIKFEVLKIGIEKAEKYLTDESVSKLVKAVLPHQADYIEKYGSSGHHYLLEEIENLLLSELKSIQKGDDSDKENTEKAALILKESEKIVASLLTDKKAI